MGKNMKMVQSVVYQHVVSCLVACELKKIMQTPQTHSAGCRLFLLVWGFRGHSRMLGIKLRSVLASSLIHHQPFFVNFLVGSC